MALARAMAILALYLLVPGAADGLAIFLMTFSQLEGMDAIKASIAIARQNLGKAIGFAGIMFVLQLIGAMMCYIGAFVALPVSIIALYLICKDIFQVETSDATDDIIEHLI